MKKISCSLLLVLATIGCIESVFAQAKKELAPKYNRFILNDGKQVIYSEFTSKGKKVNDFKYYYSFDANDVKITRGAYSGKLLHGTYSKYYYPDKILCERGAFRFGLRVGKWKEWYPNGEYVAITGWRSGYRHGKFLIFNQQGKIIEKGAYRKNKFHGKIEKMQGDSTVVVRYKNGLEIRSDSSKMRIKKNEHK
jgi:antitoxin component YwqK of YwqJK toxin-antitoxin module